MGRQEAEACEDGRESLSVSFTSLCPAGLPLPLALLTAIARLVLIASGASTWQCNDDLHSLSMRGATCVTSSSS
jgi:hypothetical protein